MSAKPSSIRERYDEHGYVIVRNVIDADLLGELRQHLDWLHVRYPEMTESLQLVPPVLVASDPFWMRVVSDERLLDIAEQFVGPSISLFQSTYFLKPPFEGRPVPWHQDGWYWPLDPRDGVVSIWLAVDESSPENGCLRVIPGSHHGVKDHVQDPNAPNGFQNQVSAEFVDEAKAVDLVLKPGDVSIHSPLAIHGSNANTSPKRRCGLTTSYLPTSTRIVRGTEGWPDETWWPNERWAASLHLRGDEAGHANEYQAWPQYDPDRHMAFRGCAQAQG